MAKAHDRSLTVERLRQILDYDPETGEFRWKVLTKNRKPVGSIAGTVRKDGYRIIGFGGQQYYAHHLAWFWTTGEWPEVMIDHRNEKPDDNRISNLRTATRSQNLQNRGRTRVNTSGFKGVHFDKRRRKWAADISVGGRSKRIGRFLTAVDAARAYDEQAAKHHGEFAKLNFPGE